MNERVETKREKVEAGALYAGRFAIDGLLGEGGFASVYAARDLELRRAVALKVLSDDPDLAELRLRMKLESELVGKAAHPAIVELVASDAGGEAGSLWLAFERLEGHDLSAELDQAGPMDFERAMHLLLWSLEGLAAAHSVGVIHRDLKPDNIYLRSPGTARERPCLIDFGIGFLDAEDGGLLSKKGIIHGTPRYMAPEYTRDQRISPAMDVFQMALIYSEMRSCVPVVDAKGLFGCYRAHTTGQRSLCEDFTDGPLGEVLTRAAAVSPEERYEDAGAFLEALLEVLDARGFAHEAMSREGLMTSKAADSTDLMPSAGHLTPASFRARTGPMQRLEMEGELGGPTERHATIAEEVAARHGKLKDLLNQHDPDSTLPDSLLALGPGLKLLADGRAALDSAERSVDAGELEAAEALAAPQSLAFAGEPALSEPGRSAPASSSRDLVLWVIAAVLFGVLVVVAWAVFG